MLFKNSKKNYEKVNYFHKIFDSFFSLHQGEKKSKRKLINNPQINILDRNQVQFAFKNSMIHKVCISY